MKRNLYLLAILFTLGTATHAAVGDTTWVHAQHINLDAYGNYDSTVTFPTGAISYRKIYAIFTLGEHNCVSGTQYCHQWDYDLENYIMTPAGDTLEMARFVTPYATSGTPGFSLAWQQHYIFDVTDFYTVLKNTGTIRVHYSGYSGGFTLDVKFAFIEGTPERNVLGYNRLWHGGFTYGNLNSVIDSNLKAKTITPIAGTISTEMKVAITGHGADSASGCCEFDGSGVGHAYNVVADNTVLASKNMNTNCGALELYPQGGTWAYARAGNWCPGSLVTVGQHKLPSVLPGNAHTVDLDFDDSYDGLKYYGIYNIEAAAFYYAGFNHSVDASLEDIVAPTTFEWYRRENPRASIPVIKVRNTGSTPITSLLIQYGVKDSAMSQYIWTGTILPLTDSTIKLPALPAITNLSLASATGQYGFVAQLLKVNGQIDEDASNNTLTSTFSIAPVWPFQFAVNMTTSTLDASGGIGGSPADASWQITDEHGVVVASRTNNAVHTSYKDTVSLVASGFYTLSVTTTQCYGLKWWALGGQPGYTSGSIVVRDYNNNLNLNVSGSTYTGQYHDDFGCGFVQYFTTLGQCSGVTSPAITRNGDTLFATGGNTYQWYYNGVKVNTATHSYYVMTHNNGNYSVKTDDGSGCTNTSLNYAVTNLGINDLTDLSSVSVSPNPTKDVFALKVSGEWLGASYHLTDLMGREIVSNEIHGETTTVSVANLASGIYLLSLGEHTKQSFKIVKE